MFVIIHNNFVVWGPKPWNKLGFEDVLRTDCEVEYTLPQRNDAEDPYVIDANTKILKVVALDHPEVNSKIQRVNGPYWNFYDTYVEQYYLAEDLPIDMVKGNLKGIVAATRYAKEVGGFTITVGNDLVSIDTSRDGRQIYFDTYLSLGDTETIGWKFAEGFKTVDKATLGMIVMAGKNHIQGCFTWEATKCAEIDAATTLADLDAINLEYGN